MKLNVFALLSCIVQFSLTAAAQPQLKIEPRPHISKVTPGDQEAKEVVTISNVGTEDLHLKVENVSCGCTDATLSTESLPPRSKGTLTIRMRLSGWGVKSESVTLHTNDPQQNYPVVTFRVTLPPSVISMPSRLMIQSREGNMEQQFVSILLPDGAAIDKIYSRNPNIQAKIAETQTVNGGTSQRIEVSLLSTAATGDLKDELVVHLKGASVPQIVVAIEGYVTPDVSVTPKQVFIEQMPMGSALRKVVVVESYNGRPFSIQSIESNISNISGKADPHIVAVAHAVEIDVSTPNKVGSVLQGKVKLTLSNGRVLEVPVVGMIVKTDTDLSGQTAVLKVGALAPAFTATDSNGNHWKLSDLRGRKNVLLTFFPKCFTGGCAGHLASVQAALPALEASQTQVLAISVDSVQEQTDFAAKLGLQFPLLPDTERQLSMLYNAAQNKTDLAARQSVLIDKQGVVRWIDTNVHVETHGADVLSKIRELGIDR